MLTASGDHKVGVWDTHTAQQIGLCLGHTGSVKSVHPHPGNPHVFASGKLRPESFIQASVAADLGIPDAPAFWGEARSTPAQQFLRGL